MLLLKQRLAVRISSGIALFVFLLSIKYMKKVILIISAIIVFLGLSCLLFSDKSRELENIPVENTETKLEDNVIKITSSGFVPSEITINIGDTVDFINKDTKPHWPASAKHPSHNAYPEKGGCIGSAFDACKGLKQGEIFSFQFDHIGEWNYHDHLNIGISGKIIVKDKNVD